MSKIVFLAVFIALVAAVLAADQATSLADKISAVKAGAVGTTVDTSNDDDSHHRAVSASKVGDHYFRLSSKSVDVTAAAKTKSRLEFDFTTNGFPRFRARTFTKSDDAVSGKREPKYYHLY